MIEELEEKLSEYKSMTAVHIDKWLCKLQMKN